MACKRKKFRISQKFERIPMFDVCDVRPVQYDKSTDFLFIFRKTAWWNSMFWASNIVQFYGINILLWLSQSFVQVLHTNLKKWRHDSTFFFVLLKVITDHSRFKWPNPNFSNSQIALFDPKCTVVCQIIINHSFDKDWPV